MTPPVFDAAAVAWSHPVRAGEPLLLMLHGWSYDETHLFGLREVLAPGLTVAALRAPFPEAGGYAWFPSGDPIGDAPAQLVNATVSVVLDWVDALDTSGTVGLLGFSQGAAMCVQLLRHRPDRFGWAVVLGGYVITDDAPGDAILARDRPPVFWGRGERDTRIGTAAVARTREFLSGHSTLVERRYPGLGHEVAGTELTDAAAFIADHSHGERRDLGER
jgi:phospholipase/carboxylesterase